MQWKVSMDVSGYTIDANKEGDAKKIYIYFMNHGTST